jgi:hypothetical protein
MPQLKQLAKELRADTIFNVSQARSTHTQQRTLSRAQTLSH